MALKPFLVDSILLCTHLLKQPVPSQCMVWAKNNHVFWVLTMSVTLACQGEHFRNCMFKKKAANLIFLVCNCIASELSALQKLSCSLLHAYNLWLCAGLCAGVFCVTGIKSTYCLQHLFHFCLTNFLASVLLACAGIVTFYSFSISFFTYLSLTIIGVTLDWYFLSLFSCNFCRILTFANFTSSLHCQTSFDCNTI